MTERLYYDDAYRTSFDARVTDCAPDADTYLVRLDRSAFYPTSGGQPYDTGTLGGANILDVFVQNGDVFHRTDAPLSVGSEVHGEIDWPRRLRPAVRRQGRRQAGFRAGRRPYRGAGSGPRAPARAIKDKDKGGGVHTNDGHTGFF